MNKNVKKIAAVAGIVVVALGAYALGGALKAPVQLPAPAPIVVDHNVTVEKIVNVEVPGQTQYVNVTVEDTTFKVLACDRLHYDVVGDCVKEVKAEDAALQIAIDKIKSDFAQELKDASLVDKTKYADLVKVYDKFEDLEVVHSNFDNSEYEFSIKVKYADTHADEKGYAHFDVSVQDGEATIESVDSI